MALLMGAFLGSHEKQTITRQGFIDLLITERQDTKKINLNQAFILF